MKYLFIHQNFPGQFRHIAKALAEDASNQVVAIGDLVNIRQRPDFHHKVQLLGYQHSHQINKNTHHYIRDYEGHIRRGQSVARVALALKEKGFTPDVVIAHPGWGEAMFMKDIFPDAKHINYFEYYYQGEGGDVGFDPEFPSNIDDQLKARVKNSTQLLSLVSSTHGLSPTNWQKSRFPEEFHSKIRVIHEGINTQIIKPDADAWIQLTNHRFSFGDEVVTYVARNLEPYRGFHSFMRSLPILQTLRPHAHVIIVGGDDVSYGRRPKEPATSYRSLYVNELGNKVDWSRVHFLGKLSHNDYLKVLQISAAHVYLTYPFVLSWSMMEAMAAGCALIASDTQPVQELISDGENGLLVNFFDSHQIAEKIASILSDPTGFYEMRSKSRRTIVENYDLFSKCLPEMISFITER